MTTCTFDTPIIGTPPPRSRPVLPQPRMRVAMLVLAPLLVGGAVLMCGDAQGGTTTQPTPAIIDVIASADARP